MPKINDKTATFLAAWIILGLIFAAVACFGVGFPWSLSLLLGFCFAPIALLVMR